MKRGLPLRESRLAHGAIGASMLAIPASAAALAGVPQDGSNTAIQVQASSRRVAYGRQLVLAGRAPRADAGRTALFEFAAGDSLSWHELTEGTIGADGRFRLAAALKQSGSVKVAVSSASAGGASLATAADDPPSSAPKHVTVAAKIEVPRRAINDLGGGPVDVRGRILPAVAGRRVKLERPRPGGWQTLATARTGSRGGFDLRYVPSGTGGARLHVRFAGDHLNASAATGAGAVTVYRQSTASWYDDGGDTACGFHAYYGVASPDLPCGTQVSFYYGGRTVTAVVDDRGPYVDGRDWDLNQNSAGALGFDGVDTVFSTQ